MFLAGPFDLVLLVTITVFFVRMCFGEPEKKPPRRRSPRFDLNFNDFKGGSDLSDPK